jgi:hypothetical protein
VRKALNFPLLPYAACIDKQNAKAATFETERFYRMQSAADAGCYLTVHYDHAAVAGVYDTAVQVLSGAVQFFHHSGQHRLCYAVMFVHEKLFAAGKKLTEVEKKCAEVRSQQVLDKWYTTCLEESSRAVAELLQVSTLLLPQLLMLLLLLVLKCMLRYRTV